MSLGGALIVAGGALALVAGLVWLIARVERRAGQLEIGEKFVRKDADDARKSGAVMAEHRTADDAAGRLRDGSF